MTGQTKGSDWLWVAECTDCQPADGGKPEWVFPHSDRDKAGGFAQRHKSLQGHRVIVTERVRTTFRFPGSGAADIEMDAVLGEHPPVEGLL